MTILICYFPWLTAQFFPREDCSIRPSPLFAYLRIWNSLMCQNVGCRSIRCAFSLTKKVAVPAAILFRSILMAAARISTSGAPTNVAFPLFTNPPIDCLQQWLIVTQIQQWLLYRRVTKRQTKRLPRVGCIKSNLRWNIKLNTCEHF